MIMISLGSHDYANQDVKIRNKAWRYSINCYYWGAGRLIAARSFFKVEINSDKQTRAAHVILNTNLRDLNVIKSSQLKPCSNKTAGVHSYQGARGPSRGRISSQRRGNAVSPSHSSTRRLGKPSANRQPLSKTEFQLPRTAKLKCSRRMQEA